MADDALYGYDGDDTGRVNEVVYRVERMPYGKQKERKYGAPPSRKPILMLALQDFYPWPEGHVMWHTTCEDQGETTGVAFARCARVELKENIKGGSNPVPTRYLRPDGEAYCCWQPMSADPGSTCTIELIKCGSYFWAQYTGIRLEVLSGGSTTIDGTCPCSWYGFALWKVVTGPAWELVENRCSGCYQNGDTPPAVDDRPSLDHPLQDVRFTDGSLNSDWLQEPLLSPPESWIDTDKLYVTCCNIEANPPDPVCELDCCFEFSFPLIGCDGEADGETTVILQGGGSGPTCSWGAELQTLFELPMGDCENDPGVTEPALVLSAGMSDATGLRIGLHYGTNSGDAIIVGAYSLSETIDCTSLTATLIGTTTSGSVWICDSCEIDNAALEALFPATIALSAIDDCDEETPIGKCCIDGECTVTTEAGCAGTWTEGGNCSGEDPCPILGRCCSGIEPPFDCAVTVEGDCVFPATWTEGLDCVDGCGDGGGCIPSGCVYEWVEGGFWELQLNACLSPCPDCDFPPLIAGDVGDIAYMDCNS